MALFGCRPTPSPSLFFGRWAIGYWQLAGTFFLGWGEEDRRFGWTDRLNLAPSEANRLEDILHLLWGDGWMQLLRLIHHGVKLLLIRRMRETIKETHSKMLVNREADGSAVIKGVEHAAVGKVIGETTLLEHLAGESSEDKMEGFVEEHCLGEL